MELKKLDGSEKTPEEVLMVLPRVVRNKLVQYLSTRPYNEVYQVIPQLNTLESVDSYNLKNKENGDGKEKN